MLSLVAILVSLVAKTAEPPPGFDERLLADVFGQGLVAHDQTGRAQHLQAVTRHHVFEGVPFPGAAPVERIRERRVHDHATPSDAVNGRGG